jgi:hypothetical protein
MALPSISAEKRLKVVDRVRKIQRDWLASTRERVKAGEPFAICNGDEAEEIFIAMDIPVLAVNYWNALILAKDLEAHYSKILNDCGYPGLHRFALGLASTLEPERAPWGGLPRPTIIVGSTRNDPETRVTELWAREFGCHYFLMDFPYPQPPIGDVPEDYWNYTCDRWDQLVDPHRLDFRTEQEKQLVSFVEQVTGRTFSIARLMRSMELINEQMDYWAKAQRLIAEAPRCPVHVRDQMSMYQAMWHRGTELGRDLIKEYYEETKARVDSGFHVYDNERYRLYYNEQNPPWAEFAEQKYGAVTVCCSYAGIPDCYARKIFNDDPMRALAARHLFLTGRGPKRAKYQAVAHRCDAVIANYSDSNILLRPDQAEIEAAGLPCLVLPRLGDNEINRGMISEFIETRLIGRRAAASSAN